MALDRSEVPEVFEPLREHAAGSSRGVCELVLDSERTQPLDEVEDMAADAGEGCLHHVEYPEISRTAGRWAGA